MIVQIDYRMGIRVRVPDGMTLYGPEYHQFLRDSVVQRVRQFGMFNSKQKEMSKADMDACGWTSVSNQLVNERTEG